MDEAPPFDSGRPRCHFNPVQCRVPRASLGKISSRSVQYISKPEIFVQSRAVITGPYELIRTLFAKEASEPFHIIY
ncbi:hypothetical protein RRF57_009357 [Xylaria bambusicola]|uniref:Uncharacterized protein n=1 Tax=Xylaria bambusicola TaxID=326684 RepID=A0AAN7UPT5_9PEZI